MTYAAQLARHYEQVRNRLHPPQRKCFRRPVVEIVEVPEVFEAEVVQFPPIIMPTRHWQQIALQIASKHEIAYKDLLKNDRSRRFAAARFEAWWRIREELGMSYPEIGSRFGGRDHSSIIHGVRKHARTLAGGA